jgi:hypothetical protein
MSDFLGEGLFWILAAVLFMVTLYRSWLTASTKHLFREQPKRKWVQIQLLFLTLILIGIFIGAIYWFNWRIMLWLVIFWLLMVFLSWIIFRNYYHRNPTLLYVYQGLPSIPRMVSLFIGHDPFFEKHYWQSFQRQDALKESLAVLFQIEDGEQVRKQLQDRVDLIDRGQQSKGHTFLGQNGDDVSENNQQTDEEFIKGEIRIAGWLYEQVFQKPLVLSSKDKTFTSLISSYDVTRGNLDKEFVIPDLQPYTKIQVTSVILTAIILLIGGVQMAGELVRSAGWFGNNGEQQAELQAEYDSENNEHREEFDDKLLELTQTLNEQYADYEINSVPIDPYFDVWEDEIDGDWMILVGIDISVIGYEHLLTSPNMEDHLEDLSVLIGDEASEQLNGELVGIIIDLFDYPEEQPSGLIFAEAEIGTDGSIYQHISTWAADERNIIVDRDLQRMYKEMEEET